MKYKHLIIAGLVLLGLSLVIVACSTGVAEPTKPLPCSR